MITFFACPKPFLGHVGIIQRNAIQSWTLLRPKPEIILVEADRGVAQTCKEFGLVHVAEVERNAFGTPLVRSVFQIGQARASHPVVCFINSDIMLMEDFVLAIETVVAHMREFLVLGQRTDVDIKYAWDFDAADWEADLKSLLAKKGTLHPPTGIDFFCFPRGMYTDIPPFAIGRPAYDNWLVWRARSKGVPVVDVTDATLIAHQNHEPLIYNKPSLNTENVPGGSNSERYWKALTPEARLNYTLVPEKHRLNILGATWILDRKGRLRRRLLTLKPAYLYYHLRRMLRANCPALFNASQWVVSFAKLLLQSGRAKRG